MTKFQGLTITGLICSWLRFYVSMNSFTEFSSEASLQLLEHKTHKGK